MTLDPLLSAPLEIQVHATSAIAAFGLGALVLLRRKGTRLHKLLGRLWVVLMLVVATSSLFIHEIRMIGPFSPIHLFALATYAGLWTGIRAIRRGDVVSHKAAMQSTYLGALILAGAFTFLPGRRMHDVLFGADAGWVPSAVVIGAALTAVAVLWRKLMPRRVHAA